MPLEDGSLEMGLNMHSHLELTRPGQLFLFCNVAPQLLNVCWQLLPEQCKTVVSLVTVHL